MKAAFGGRLSCLYSIPQGTFREQCGIFLADLIGSGLHLRDIRLQITLASDSSLNHPISEPFDYDYNRNKIFAPEILLLTQDTHHVTLTRDGYGAAKEISPRCDIAGLKECYSSCLREHGASCDKGPVLPAQLERDVTDRGSVMPLGVARDDKIQLSNRILLVDVQEMCLRWEKRTRRYLTLSYVSGTTSFCHLNAGNYQELQRPYSLLDAPLPQTFRDAILLTQHLGEKYLWIDALCIIQDDADFKTARGMKIAQIFAASALTIIAASGCDVEAGLPRLSTASDAGNQVIENIGGLRFALLQPPLEVVLRNLKWNNLGWTAQEYILSRRNIIFTDQQAYFNCCLGNFSEDYHMVKLQKPPIQANVASVPLNNHPLYSKKPNNISKNYLWLTRGDHSSRYDHLVRDFTTRQLTNESDVLKAISGLLSMLAISDREQYLCSLPVTCLDWALLWQPDGRLRRREPSAESNFPSWSWIGWIGPVKYYHYLGEGGPKSEISWLFLATLPSTENIGGRSHLVPYTPGVKEAQRKYQQTQWQSPGPASADDWIRRTHPLIESGILKFNTQFAFFQIDPSPTGNSYAGCSEETACFKILDRASRWAGSIHLEVGMARDQNILWNHAEFILLSMTYYCHEKVEEVQIGRSTFDVGKFEKLDIKNKKRLLCNVMWIWQDADTSYRRGVGQIHLHAWNAAQPGKKEIRLG